MTHPEPKRETGVYLHGTSAAEQARLGIMNRILNEGSLREMAFRGGERILDLGSGLGDLTRAMRASAGPGASALGIERSAEQLRAARGLSAEAGEGPGVEFRAGDATAPPLRDDEWGAFDVAHTRFLLEHVPDPLAVVRPMVRAVRPGGRVILQDEDHSIFRLSPPLPSLEAVWEAYYRTYERVGNDPYVGRRLVTLLHEAGAVPRRCTWIFFGGCAGMEIFPLLLENLRVILEEAREAILAGGAVGEAAFERGMKEYAAWGKRPDAAWWFALAYAEGIRPGA
ncbi:MAG TPA: methyltransferase domain-containing protein [Candidatus Eisenbacteria bacterium]|nr:methyltransferase domain-containing protein [Candidatus Eisenbacteria bacterium]